MPEPLPEHHDHLAERYEELVASDRQPSKRVVAISGKRAAGTSTHAAHLALKFGIEHVDNGTLQRRAAEKHGYNDVERFREEHPDADLEVDAAKLDRAFSGEPLIAEGRLDAAALCADRGDGEPIAPVRIKIICNDEKRFKRYTKREYNITAPDGETLKQARNEVREADQKIREIFADLYNGLNPHDDGYYTHIIDNSGDYEQTHQRLVSILENHGFKRRQPPQDELENITP
ncbi:MAG: hypothetical protein SV186_00055 [Candidatus Nanohaloarchaea archaeon]|nr:hypothetical protein [Candidatus Nanohaloarchaea archaeon]